MKNVVKISVNKEDMENLKKDLKEFVSKYNLEIKDEKHIVMEAFKLINTADQRYEFFNILEKYTKEESPFDSDKECMDNMLKHESDGELIYNLANDKNKLISMIFNCDVAVASYIINTSNYDDISNFSNEIDEISCDALKHIYREIDMLADKYHTSAYRVATQVGTRIAVRSLMKHPDFDYSRKKRLIRLKDLEDIKDLFPDQDYLALKERYE